MSKRSKLLSKLVTITTVFLLLIVPAVAFEEGDVDSNPENQQDIDGTTVPDDQPVTGDIDVNGWIGVYDGDTDPNVPQPPVDGNAWIDVTIPKTVLFGSLATDNGKVYGPIYTITNNSTKEVEVSTVSFSETGSSVPAVTNELDLNLVTDSHTLPLLKREGKFLGTDFTGESLGVVGISTNNKLTFTLKGQFHGNYPEVNTPALPTYKLVLQFKAQKLES